jgi:hypothetical protein
MLSFIILASVYSIHPVFSVSPLIGRQEIIDDLNDWQPWNIKNGLDSDKNTGYNNSSSPRDPRLTESYRCKDHPLQFPNIQSISYMSDGDKLNATVWLSQLFSESLYSELLRNETLSPPYDFSANTSVPASTSDELLLDSSSLSSSPRIIQFVMVIDILSVFDKGIDYTVELSSPTEPENPQWTRNVYEISAFGNKKLIQTKSFDSFPFNDKDFVDFSIDLNSIGNPDKYKLLFYIADLYPVDGNYCRQIDTSSWSLIPTPKFTIIPSTSNVIMKSNEIKDILVVINTNSALVSKAILGINYTDISNNTIKNKKEDRLSVKFVPNNITISPYLNNSVILHITTPSENDLTNSASKQIPIQISANISFPQTITNRGGDTFYNNKTISMLESSDLTLTILPPLSFNEQLENFTKSIQPIGELWGVITTIGLGLSGFMAFLYKQRKKGKKSEGH